MKLGKNREREIEELEQARLSRLPLHTQPLPAQLHLSASSGQPGGDQ
jgi:hypothetical protein